MVQKIIDVVGISTESFAKAADDAVRMASKTVRNMKWARVSEMEIGIEGEKVLDFRTTLRIYFDVD